MTDSTTLQDAIRDILDAMRTTDRDTASQALESAERRINKARNEVGRIEPISRPHRVYLEGNKVMNADSPDCVPWGTLAYHVEGHRLGPIIGVQGEFILIDTGDKGEVYPPGEIRAMLRD